jgi:hypothetical protein
MIGSIGSGSDYIIVSGGKTIPNSLLHSNVQNELRVTGNIRYNANVCQLEVYDGHDWCMFNTSHAAVDLTARAKEILGWAEHKMHEERKLRAMMERHPGLKDLNDKLEMMKVLCQEEEKQT